VVVGDPAVGKTALVQMFASSGTRFPKQYNMTCGVELAHKITLVAPPAADSEANVELYMLDSGGQDMFEEMLPPFWEGAPPLSACAPWRSASRGFVPWLATGRDAPRTRRPARLRPQAAGVTCIALTLPPHCSWQALWARSSCMM